MKEISLYIHFPFCLKKCSYCDFKSFDDIRDLMPAYLEALKKEIIGLNQFLSDYIINTIYLGGGTPTIFDAADISRVLSVVRDNTNISAEAEITIETNPSTLNKQKLSKLREAGINRISLGFQAAQKSHLNTLGRSHSTEDFVKSTKWIKETGFNNFNADILISLPNQTFSDLLETTTIAIENAATHISLYSLKLEENTELYKRFVKGELIIPNDYDDRTMFHSIKDALQKKGYFRYEISNFSKTNYECKHNLNYWENHEYIGCGSSAHSYINNTRYANQSDVISYINAITDNAGLAKSFEVKVEKPEARFETLMLGLRMVKGVNKEKFKDKFGQEIGFYYDNSIKILKNKQLVSENEKFLFCTEKGLDLQNYVLMHFMD